MNTLDSRSLHLHDCFAQTFPAGALGQVQYVLVAGALIPDSPPPDTSNGFTINVGPKTQAGPSQFTVAVTLEGGELTPTPKQLSIAVGDIVLWHRADGTPRRYCVFGTGPIVNNAQQFTFSSAALTEEAIYVHAFGSPGTYDWIDAIAGARPDPRPGGAAATVQGTVVVSATKLAVDADRKNYLAALATPATFEVQGSKVTPAQVNIVVGQRVFWKVWDGSGVTITDKRLVPSAH